MSQERNEKKVRQKAETKDGRKVTNLVRNEFGYFGTVDNVRISGKGDSWTLQFKD
jgi:hypothetical protein